MVVGAANCLLYKAPSHAQLEPGSIMMGQHIPKIANVVDGRYFEMAAVSYPFWPIKQSVVALHCFTPHFCRRILKLIDMCRQHGLTVCRM